MADLWTVKDVLDWTIGYLESKGDPNPRLSAEWLTSEATGLSRVDLYVQLDRPLSLSERDTLRGYVARRVQGEPLQLISGTAPFRYLVLQVAPGVLIPRPETEVLVSEAFVELRLPRVVDHIHTEEEGEALVSPDLPCIRVIDLCTGSGCIACALASEYPQAQVLALDIASEALMLAQRNVEQLNLEQRVEVRKSDLLSALSPDELDSFDLLISNPPYVPTKVLETLDAEVSAYEPRLALDGGSDGLDVVRSFLPDALRALRVGGVLALELFEDHLDAAQQLVEQEGFVDTRVALDLAGKPRVLIAHKPVL